jgi:hypothetical protein
MRWIPAHFVCLVCRSLPLASAIAFQEGDKIRRRDVAVDRSMIPTAQGYLKQLFQGRIYANPAKQNSVLIQVGQETVSVQFWNHRTAFGSRAPVV